MVIDATYLVAAMVSWVPISDHAYYEPRATTEARYLDLATAITRVTHDPLEALVLASIGSYESAFHADVMACRTHGGTARAPSWGPFQIAGHKPEACDPDATLGAHEALRQVRESLALCRREPLSRYTTGRCMGADDKAHWRLLRATKWYATHPPEAHPS